MYTLSKRKLFFSFCFLVPPVKVYKKVVKFSFTQQKIFWVLVFSFMYLVSVDPMDRSFIPYQTNSIYVLSMNLLTVPDNWLFELICFSSNWLARPLWSPLINWLELFIDVQWSGNQLITPIGLLVFKSNMFNWETIWSVLCLYLEIII